MQKLDKNVVASFLNRQIEDWDTANKNFTALKDVKVKTFTIGKSNFKVQFNPARITSSAAKVDPKSLKERKCFLCAANRPAIQEGIEWGKYTVLVNPFPILPRHLTIPDNGHVDQKIEGRIADMMNLAAALEDYTLFYNGPKCGASAPDHMHFQGGNCGFMPVEEDINNADKAEVAVAGNSKMFLAKGLAQSCFFIEAQCVEEGEELFNRLYAQLTTPEGEIEPMLNILCRYTGSEWNIFVFPRKKHRPDCYFKEGDENILISPASVDMGGVFITPLEKDFEKITAEDVKTILDEVCLSEQEAQEIADKL